MPSNHGEGENVKVKEIIMRARLIQLIIAAVVAGAVAQFTIYDINDNFTQEHQRLFRSQRTRTRSRRELDAEKRRNISLLLNM